MGEFTAEQEAAIAEKLELFSSLTEPGLHKDQAEVMRRIRAIEADVVAKRLRWFEEHRHEMDYLDRDDLTDAQKAFALVFGHYMGIERGSVAVFADYDPAQGIINVNVRSRNFCPYLEAFKRMNLRPYDSVKLCELALHAPCQALIDKINPKVRFFRDYRDYHFPHPNIRPYEDFCDEGLIMRDFSLCERIEGDPCDLFVLNADSYWELAQAQPKPF